MSLRLLARNMATCGLARVSRGANAGHCVARRGSARGLPLWHALGAQTNGYTLCEFAGTVYGLGRASCTHRSRSVQIANIVPELASNLYTRLHATLTSKFLGAGRIIQGGTLHHIHHHSRRCNTALLTYRTLAQRPKLQQWHAMATRSATRAPCQSLSSPLLAWQLPPC
jgi:hypothetical protein